MHCETNLPRAGPFLISKPTVKVSILPVETESWHRYSICASNVYLTSITYASNDFNSVIGCLGGRWGPESCTILRGLEFGLIEIDITPGQCQFPDKVSNLRVGGNCFQSEKHNTAGRESSYPRSVAFQDRHEVLHLL